MLLSVVASVTPVSNVVATPYAWGPEVVTDNPILLILAADAVKAPVTVKVLVDPAEPKVRVPVLLKVVADAIVELTLPITSSRL